MSNYRVVLRGVMAGRSVDQVAAALARLSNKTPQALKPMLSGKPVVAKRTDEVQKAVRYKKALEKIGCVCVIEAEITTGTVAKSVALPTESAISVNLTTVTDSSPPPAREYEYAKPPTAARLRALFNPLGLKEWLIIGALLVILCYFGLKHL